MLAPDSAFFYVRFHGGCMRYEMMSMSQLTDKRQHYKQKNDENDVEPQK
jgi:hypothetical protein